MGIVKGQPAKVRPARGDEVLLLRWQAEKGVLAKIRQPRDLSPAALRRAPQHRRLQQPTIRRADEVAQASRTRQLAKPDTPGRARRWPALLDQMRPQVFQVLQRGEQHPRLEA